MLLACRWWLCCCGWLLIAVGDFSSLLSRLLIFRSVFRYGWLLGWRGMGLAIRQSYPQGGRSYVLNVLLCSYVPPVDKSNLSLKINNLSKNKSEKFRTKSEKFRTKSEKFRTKSEKFRTG